MSKANQHILIVDDELEIRKIIQEILNDEGYSTAIASSADEARKQANKKKPDLVLLDIWMPDEDGISLLKDWATQAESNFPVIMISGHATIETAIKATKLGAKDFIEKPVSMEKLLSSTAVVLSQNSMGEDACSHLLENTPAFIKTLESFEIDVQQQKIFVIQSEEGLDKAAWARAIHSKHLSRDMGFKVLSNSQKESRSGQKNNNLYVELDNAEPAAIFIGDIKNLSNDEKEVISKKLIVYSRNRASKIFIGVEDIDEASFLGEQNIVLLEVPPLRNALKDIPQMLEEAIKFFVERDGHGYRRFSLASQNMLSKYQWPGNLRQLLDLVQALLSRKDKEIVNVEEVQEIITLQGPGGNILMENNILSLSMREAKKLFERAYLVRQMELVGGKISELSRRVDMERTNLYRKLQSLDIEYKKKKKPTS
ncbi:response regulator [Gammaproteobacteria bacterium]|nr:response regulator [Gammaproteobacteria bacterium]